MNYILNEIKNALFHYGVSVEDGAPGRGSGRYPLGSGDVPFQHDSGDFLGRIEKMTKDGCSETEIAAAMGMSTTELRTQKSLAKADERSRKVAQAKELREGGMSLNQIATEMGFANDSSVRSLLNEDSEARMKKAQVTADYLKDICDDKGMIDVTVGVERELGVSKEKMREALKILEDQGYMVYKGGIPQVTNPGKQINMTVLCPPGTEHKEIYNFDNVHSVKEYDRTLTDGGDRIVKVMEYPSSMSSDRLAINYAEDGGIKQDGLVEIRRGVKDLSLGDSNYAQVRILVDGTHYIKGMAVYADDLPNGVDVRFNTNKTKDVSKMDVLKKIKDDPDNPFGSLIKANGQSFYDDPNGKYTDPVTGNKQSLSLINKRAEEGDWGEWSDNLPSQFLAKQSKDLINKQLNLAIADKQSEYDQICNLTNPTVKKNLLQAFADECDSAAVHLKAAALPRQKYQVILPLTKIKDDEIFAPNYQDGEQVAVIRYPHGGTFEIAICKVNNKNKQGKDRIGINAKDAVGISSKVAERLSGADFDGDTVMIIPINKNIKIISTPQLEGLKDFDPKLEYPERPGMRYMKNTQTEMGKVSNLITDMTLLGATNDELARAVRHSMVVIDAEKHKLDYKRSEADNDIASLRKKYQRGKSSGGASTLISRAKGQQSVDKRQGSPMINQKGKDWYDPTRPEGALLYKTADPDKLYYVDRKTGKTVKRTQKSTQMAETDDARTLISPARTPQELAYANYANKMKALANSARKEMVTTGRIQYNPQAKETYKVETDHLKAQLNEALLNKPKERAAQRVANTRTEAAKKRLIEEGCTKQEMNAELKKIKQRELTQARANMGAQRLKIDISDREWEAIQAGAISENTLSQILLYADSDRVRQLATPRTSSKSLSTSQIGRIKGMKASGYTNAEIAKALGISASTVSKYL